MKNNLPYNVMRHRDWDVAPRDPMTVGNAIFAAIGAQTGSIALIWGVGYLATTAITSLALSALAPSVSTANQGRIVNAREATGSQEYVYGQVRKGGTITFMESTGDNNKFLHLVITLAGHEVEEIVDIYINDEVVTLSADNKYSYKITLVSTINPPFGSSYDQTTDVYVSGVDTAHTVYSVDDTITQAQLEALVAAADSSSGMPTFSAERVFVSATVASVSSDNGYVEGDRWRRKIRIKEWDGSQTTADSDFIAETSADSNFVGNGIAALYVRLEYDGEVFTNGVPTFTALIKGRKVYNPDTGVTAYSANAALCIRDYLTTDIGLSDSEVNDTYFVAAMNDCDDDISLAAGGTQPRYEINGVIRAENDIGQNLQDMVRACNGTLYIAGGEWRLRVGVYEVPVKTFTLDDLRSDIELQTKHSRRDNFNRVVGRFIHGGVHDPDTDTGGDWVEAEYPPIESATFLAEDADIENTLDLTLNMVTSPQQAQRVAKQTLFRSREQMTLTAEFGLAALEVEVGDTVAMTVADYGWTAKEFEVVTWKLIISDGGGLRVSMTLRETSSAAFDWNAEEADIAANDTTVADVITPPEVTNLVASATKEVQADGTVVPAVNLEWDVSDPAFVGQYEVFWGITGGTYEGSTTTTRQNIVISPLISGETYTLSVRARSAAGRLGALSSVSFTSEGDTTAPDVPTSIAATGGTGLIALTWVNPTDADLKAINIYVSDTGVVGDATLLSSVSGTYFVHTGLADNVTKYYHLRSVDFSGNLGTYTSPVSATTSTVSTDGLAVSGDATIGGDLQVDGDFTVSGTTTFVDTTNLDVQDAVITLNKGQTTPLNDIGILMQRYATADATNYNIGIAWDEDSDRLIVGKTPEDGSDNELTFNTEWMTILASGAVGLGTSAPDSMLHVTGNIHSDTDLYVDGVVNAGGGVLITEAGPASLTLDNTADSAGQFRIQLNDTARFSYVGSSVVEMELDGSGNLTLHGSVEATGVIIGAWTVTESGGSLYFSTGGVNKMKLDANGNLDIAGNVSANATIT